jgi:hypothetical protein
MTARPRSPLERHRLGRGLSASDVARASNLSHQAIARCERTANTIRETTIERYRQVVDLNRQQFDALRHGAGLQHDLFGETRRIDLNSADWQFLDRFAGGPEVAIALAVALLRAASALSPARQAAA